MYVTGSKKTHKDMERFNGRKAFQLLFIYNLHSSHNFFVKEGVSFATTVLHLNGVVK